MSMLYNWSIATNNDSQKYLIGENRQGKKIVTDYILNQTEFTNEYMTFRLINGESYVVYFHERLLPSYGDRVLYNWSIKYNNSDACFDEPSTLRIYGSLDTDGYDLWRTTTIVRYEYYKDYIVVFTESGSSYILYEENNKNDYSAADINCELYNCGLLN